jgi:hypothetical protein
MDIFFRLISIINFFHSEIISYCLNLGLSSVLMMLIFTSMCAIALSVRFKDKFYSLISRLVDVESRKKDLFHFLATNDADSIIRFISIWLIGVVNFSFFLIYISSWLFGHLPTSTTSTLFALQLLFTGVVFAISDFKWMLLTSFFNFFILLSVYPLSIISYASDTNLFESLDPNFLIVYNINLDWTYLEIANSIFSVFAPYCIWASMIVMIALITIKMLSNFFINGTLKILVLATKDSEF